MNIVQKTIGGIDAWQRRHRYPAFLYAVIKKYSDDQAGYQVALVTYYGFLSLFPLLLVLTTVAGMIGQSNPEFGQELIKSVSSYFPVFGQALDDSVRSLGKNGPALIIGLLFALYGARGSADAFRNAVNHIWHVPVAKRSGFPRSLIRSLGIIVGGGGGFILAAVVAGWTANANRGWSSAVVTVVVNLVLLFAVFMLIFRLSLPLSVSFKKFRISAIICAVGIAVLQMVGVIILSSQAEHLSSTYSALFVTTLGLLAWIYLQMQVVMYAIEIATVRNGKLWPRGLTGDQPTKADAFMEDRKAA